MGGICFGNSLSRALAIMMVLLSGAQAHAKGFSIKQILSAPFASGIVAAPDGRDFAWVSNVSGHRNVWLATVGPGNTGLHSRALTRYSADDGLDLTELAFIPHHAQLLYVLGGDAEYPDKPAANPAQLTTGVDQEIYLVGLRGGTPLKLAPGHAPLASPDGDRVLYLRHGEVFSIEPRQGAKPAQLFKIRGAAGSLRFSPNGRQLAFVSNRGDHSFIGVYTFSDKSLIWIDASFSMDVEPRWSLDGTRLAFLRIPSTHDEVGLIAHRIGSPWSIRVATLAASRVVEAYRAPREAGSVFHPLSSDVQLMWSGNNLVFPAENDGWLHLYSVPASGGGALLLTPGQFEIEYASANADGTNIVYAGNEADIDRRHLWRLRLPGGTLEQLTRGAGIETQPVVVGHGSAVALLRSDAHIPAHVALLEPGRGLIDLMAEGLPADFPMAELVAPESVLLPERAGMAAHGQLFLPPPTTSNVRHPAVVFMHGGPVRQMLAGWHYMDYYSNAYGLNQYLASRGYVVLALNYRAGIGYGLNFREADGIGAAGAGEYKDLLAAAALLRSRPDVDPTRLGLWGGSYGGYMTALGLARNSDLFAAGVDLHGVHDWHHWTLAQRDNQPLYGLDASAALLATALAASPISSIASWRSPVLLIHGDDDHNVEFSESVRLAEALRAQGVDYSELVFPDEIHGFLRHASWLRTYTAAAAFLDAKLAPSSRQ